MATAIARYDRCGSWPAIGFLKRLIEQEDRVIIAGMALLFPTALVFYLGVKVIFPLTGMTTLIRSTLH